MYVPELTVTVLPSQGDDKISKTLFNTLTDKKIALLGWAFKKETDDSRESAAIYVTEKLYNAGATLEIYDPMVLQDSIIRDISYYWDLSSKLSQDRIKVLKEAPNFKEIDLAAILTEWEEFKNLDFENSSVFDGRNLFEKTYYSIGK